MDIQLKKNRIFFLVFSLFLTLLFCWPWLARDFVGIEHDTLFHLSRIDAFSEALFHGDLIPRIYPYENFGYGYASPMFYCDFFLILPSVLYHFGLPLSSAYVLTCMLTVFASTYAVACLCERITENPMASAVVSAAFCFANYHITDIYVRSALGEAMALVFLPILLEGLYILFQEQKEEGGVLLFLGLTGLILSHNLTFLMGAILAVLFFVMFAQDLRGKLILSFFLAFLAAFLVTAWFTLPMVEQLASQDFYLGYYGSSSDLENYALEPWQYLRNTTVFGYGSNTMDSERQMTMNIGYFLTLAPLTFLLPSNHQKKDQPFILLCLILGYILLFLPIRWFPWKSMRFLRIIQFPWRLLTVSMVLLTIPSACGIHALFQSQKLPYAFLSVLLCAEGVFHVAPVLNRSFGITSANSYSDLLSGELIDPCFSATYVRVQLAGGEYLPSGSPDFRELPPAIRSSSLEETGIPFQKNRTSITFHVDHAPDDGTLILPLSWYHGYSLKDSPEGTVLTASNEKLAELDGVKEGTYTVVYGGTILQKLSAVISLLSSLALLFWKMKQKLFPSAGFPAAEKTERTV